MSSAPGLGVFVLLCGYRKGLADALASFGVPFCVWHDRPLRSLRAFELMVARFPRTLGAVRKALQQFPDARHATHVMAGTEGSVVAASLARRILDTRRVPHSVSLRCHDKLFMKEALTALGVPTVDYVNGNRVERLSMAIQRLGLPLVVKHRRESGGRGQEIVRNAADGPQNLRGRLAERFIDAPEVSVESFVAGGRILFENVTEYRRKRHVNVLPAALPSPQLHRLLMLNRQALDGLRVQWGVTHLESFLAPQGPLFNELALRPPGGYIMELLSHAYGFDAWKAFVAVELDHSWVFPTVPRAHAAAIILHPGPGRITKVTGVRDVKRHPSVVKARIKVRAGDVVAPRIGAGQDVGYLLLCEHDRRRLLEAIDQVENMLTIEQEPS